MEAYLDNSATTRCLESVRDVVSKTMLEDYGNPSSKHMKGVESERYLKDARETIAKTLKVNEKEIYFTSGGTESNNWALLGSAYASRRAGKHIITTAIEHAAVLMPLQFLAEQGYRITHLPVDEHGHISLADLKAALDEETILVSIMMVNNEIGAIEPVAEAGEIIKKYNPDILFHVDAIQAYGKLPIYPKKQHIDLLSVSAHKIHGLKGAGALYVRQGLHIKPYLCGGGQENGLVSGTQATPAIAAFGAATAAVGDIRKNAERVSALRMRLVSGLREIAGIRVNSPENALPYIVNISVEGIPSQVSVNFLSSQGVYVSAGSACAKGHRSPVLTAMGLCASEIDTAVRISLSRETTEDEIDACINAIKTEVQTLRKKG